MKLKLGIFLLVAITFLPILTHGLSFLGLFFYKCNSTQHVCEGGTCLETKYVCDGVINCSDGSDEEPSQCEIKKCLTPKYFKCDDGKCIHANISLCDGIQDCSDGSDEEKCTSEPASKKIVSHASCANNSFLCSDGQCIPKSWVCDGNVDCSDDETLGCVIKQDCENHEFMCTKSKSCIPKLFVCDGYQDCADGSDELSCETKYQPIVMNNCTRKNFKFACKDNLKCIDLHSVCDGKKDCYDYSDEDYFCQISSLSHCINCTHRCVDTPEGGLCLCDSGYTLGDNNKCIDVNECEIYGICDQECVNTAGSYHCACDSNYILQVDGRTCFIKDGETTLVYSLSHAIKELTLRNRTQYLYFENIPFTIGISAVGQDLYWTHGGNGSQSIMKARDCQNNGCREQEMIITNGLGAPEDVALDWITRNIYFSDNKYKHIVACSGDGYVCTVLHMAPVLDKPRDITLIPERGLMFWTDWGKRPHIGRSGMDGSNATEFISEDVMWPNGVAIDLPNERLYWVEAKNRRVETIKLDRTDRRIILSESIHHPLSVAVFENKLYWSDLTDKEIHSCDKFTGKGRQSITRENYDNIHVIHIRHPLLEQTKMVNPCGRHVCSDLCLLAPGSKGLNYSCACPSNKNLAEDSSKCVEIRENPLVLAVKKNRIYLMEHSPLGRSKIASHRVLNELYVTAVTYNSRQDAILLADSFSKSVYTYSLRYKVLNPLITHRHGPLGLIISMEYDYFGNNVYWCDADSGSVEAFSLTTFSSTVIVEGTFAESPISLTLAPEHGFMYVAYENVSQDVRVERISMDGNRVTRKNIVYNINAAKLHYSKELKRLFWANMVTGEIESADIDGNDLFKIDVADSLYSLTSSGGILFWSSSRSPIISWHNFYSDEYSRTLKLDSAFGLEGDVLLTVLDRSENTSSLCSINNGGCSHLCLRSYDSRPMKICGCPAGLSIGADGQTCSKPKSCSLDEFTCFTGECLPRSHVCDSKKDCIHGEDEDLQHCSGPKCPPDQFLCFDQSRCIDRKLICDKKADCDDKSDEICAGNCAGNQFTCDSGECIDRQFRCDLKVDCRDAHDEFHCSLVNCSGDEFRCDSGQCIPRDWRCDEEPDCTDGSDESTDICERNIDCLAYEFRCSNEKCIHMSLTCDGFDDCGDDSDEYRCFSREEHNVRHRDYIFKLCNPKLEFFCTSNERHCIPLSARCNGTKECVRGEDEEYCSVDSNPCTPGKEFFCALHHNCIPMELVCDNNDDCGDGSDETREACFNKPMKNKPCAGFKCNSSECIALSKMCDNIGDCSDKSDENKKCYMKCEGFGCSQKCFSTPHGPECRCKNGFELSVDNKTCVDVNECELGICAQKCTNLAGGFSCGCYTPDYLLRRDRVSCKASGPSFMYVVASKNMLYVTSNNLKHTTELQLLKPKFNSILKIDVDGFHNHVYILLENDIIEKVSLDDQDNRTQFYAPQITDFTVDWITETLYVIHDHRCINASNFDWVNSQKRIFNINLYTSHEYFYISALSVDPVAGYLFWYESEIDILGSVGMIRRADCTGENVVTLLPGLWYPVREIVIDSFNRRLYWFDLQREAIYRMDYDASSIENMLDSEGEITTFTLFENSIYFVSPGFITIRKCKIYGLPPKQCEFVKVNMHEIRHLSILQPNLQRTVRNLCEEYSCSDYGLCSMSPTGPQCVCPNGKIQNENVICSQTGAFSEFVSSTNNTVGSYFAHFVIFCLLAGVVWITFSHFIKRKGKILHRLHFHNPVYESSHKGRASASQALLNAEEHPCENRPVFEVAIRERTAR